MKFPSRPQHGKSFVQEFGNSINQIIDYLPSLEVRGDQKSTYVTKSSKGTVIHATEQNPSTRGKEYFAGSGLTLSGNTFHNAVTSGRYIEITSAFEINCTLSAGNNIEITPNGVINCTLTGGGGGGGNTYYADNFTLSTTSPTGNTFCLYDVYPLITGAGGTTVYRYGDSPLYPDHALGTCISSLYYYGANGIAIEEDGGGSYGAKVSITADFDYHAGTGISIDPATRTINCTVEPGGGGETYYADESTIKLSSTNNTFYLYDVEPLLTGAGGIIVYNYGTDGLSRRVTGISATPYTGGEGISVDNYVISLTATIPTKTSDLTNDSHFITINDVPPGSVYQGDNVTIAASGTNNNIFYVIDGVFAPLTTVVNLSTELSGHIDYVSSHFPLSTSELVNDVPFVTSTDLDDYFKWNAFEAVGDHLQYVPRLGRLNCTLTGGDWIYIDSNDQINCTLTGLDQLANTPGYITSPGPTPTAYYADNDTLSTTDNGTKFYVRNISTLLTGAGGTTVYYYGTGLNDTVVAGISSLNYQGGNGIQITPVEGQGGVATTYASIGLSSQFYNDLTAISTRPATGDKILSSHNGTLSWETNNASSPTWTSLTPSLLAVNNNNHTLSAATQSGGGGGGGGQSVNYIFSSGIYQATAGSKWIVRYPHIPIYWSEDEEDAPWPEGWQPPKDPDRDEYISQQWPLYQYYYNQPAEPQLPCGYLCSLYSWAEGNYGYMKGQWDILLKLPSVNERTIVEVINYTDTALAVVTDNGKQIIPQSFNNSVGDSQHSYAIQYSNNLYSFKHGSYNGCCKIVFYYDPAPPYTPERTPYTPAIMEQLTSGGCWFAQIFTD